MSYLQGVSTILKQSRSTLLKLKHPDCRISLNNARYLSLCRPLLALTPPDCPFVNGDFKSLSPKIQEFLSERISLCKPDSLHICDGSEAERDLLLKGLTDSGAALKLRHPDLENCYAVRTNPADVARVESRTLICTEDKNETIPTCAEGAQGRLGQWCEPDAMDEKLDVLFDGCMKGRTMYLIPFSMGPVGSPLSKIGIELTDSPYVTVSMRVMTRMGKSVLDVLGNDDFVKCLHSVGQPLPTADPDPFNWPCNPKDTVITHFPHRKEIKSYGSGYGGNSLLGKKCFALRIGSCIARDEGWFAEHMLILGVTNPEGEKKYIAAAFPSACGKTNLAMMEPSLPGWKVECVGDDIAWMKFDKNGVLRAINPENGFFGVAPGTSMKTNPNAIRCCDKDTVFTNVATTSDGNYWWEGLEKERDLSNTEVTDWLGKPWAKDSSSKAAHGNSRFCTPASNCPIMDPLWEDSEGVPISAILFGGRRPKGVPLIYEANDWSHGVFIASSMCSETTAAAEHKGTDIMRDPFAMRPFFGYNAGHYLQHWLSMQDKEGYQLPKIFHVNWFRKGDKDDKFLWPGFGENSRVLKWICERIAHPEREDEMTVPSAIGRIPKPESLDLSGLGELNMDELMSVPKKYWLSELDSIKEYYNEQFGEDLPKKIWEQHEQLVKRIQDMEQES